MNAKYAILVRQTGFPEYYLRESSSPDPAELEYATKHQHPRLEFASFEGAERVASAWQQSWARQGVEFVVVALPPVGPWAAPPNPILKYFECDHLPEKLRGISLPVREVARFMEAELPDGPEKSAGLRKLLEAKDCFVRAKLG